MKDWDYLTLGPKLKDKSMLLVSATNDSDDEGPAMHASMERALRSAGSKHVKNVVYEDDHPFSANRVPLTQLLVQWLATDCAAVWKTRR
jgi:hypothetical protein